MTSRPGEYLSAGMFGLTDSTGGEMGWAVAVIAKRAAARVARKMLRIGCLMNGEGRVWGGSQQSLNQQILWEAAAFRETGIFGIPARLPAHVGPHPRTLDAMNELGKGISAAVRRGMAHRPPLQSHSAAGTHAQTGSLQ